MPYLSSSAIAQLSRNCHCRISGSSCKAALNWAKDRRGLWYRRVTKRRCSFRTAPHHAPGVFNLGGIRGQGKWQPAFLSPRRAAKVSTGYVLSEWVSTPCMGRFSENSFVILLPSSNHQSWPSPFTSKLPPRFIPLASLPIIEEFIIFHVSVTQQFNSSLKS